MILTWLTKYRDLGLLLLRVGIGAMFVFVHGWPKLQAGAARWKEVGGAMKYLGIHFAPEMWGLLAALSEFGGGILLIIGLAFRPAALMLFCTMVVATYTLYSGGASFTDWSHPLKMAFVFFALIFVGAGRFSLDKE